MPGALRTLRLRLAAAFFVWTALIQLALVLILPPLREASLIEEMDERLAGPASELALKILDQPLIREGAEAGEVDLTSLAIDNLRKGWGELLFLQLRDRGGRVVGASSNLAGTQFPFDPADVPNQGIAFTTAETHAHTPDGRPDPRQHTRARVATLRVRGHGASDPYYLQVGMSMESLDRFTSIFNSILLIAVLGGIAGAGAAGWIVAGTVVSRIERVARAVRNVNAERLDERIDLATGDDEIGRMAADVNAMLRRLAIAFRAQERFISDVSHELKTPVAALLAEAQVLKYRKPSPEDVEYFVTSVEDEMRRLGKLVESFLMLARFGHGRRFVDQELVSMNEVGLESVQHSMLLAEQYHVNLNVHLFEGTDDIPDALVRGDAELLRVVIDNLIRNAVHYSIKGQTVNVRVDCSESDVIVSVADQGRGIPPGHLDKIFDRFAQAPNAMTGRRGTGLGLAIAKGVVDLHAGSITARNRPEGGCEFMIRLARVREGEPEPPPEPIPQLKSVDVESPVRA